MPRSGWSFDIITNLPKSENNQTALLLAMDIFSRYTTAYFLENKSQKAIASAVNSHLTSFGTPKYILSDSDPSLIAVFKPLAIKLDFFYSTTPPRAQHLNSVERAYKELKKFIQKYVYDPSVTENDRTEWPLATILSIQALNSLPLRNLDFSREQIMFRFEMNSKLSFDPFTNKTMSHLDKQVLNNVLHYIKYHENSDKPLQQKFFVDQVVYIKNSIAPLPGEQKAYKTFTRGPLKVTQVDNIRKTIVCYCPDSEKYFTSHFKDVIRLSNPNKVLPIFTKDWSRNLEIKASNHTAPLLKVAFQDPRPPD